MLSAFESMMSCLSEFTGCPKYKSSLQNSEYEREIIYLHTNNVAQTILVKLSTLHMFRLCLSHLQGLLF
jgi:hypothetical protein